MFVPAPPVDVVEAVGAGDAFAAGYLSGLLDGLPTERRLSLGHAVAGAVLRSEGDTLETLPEEVSRIREAHPPRAQGSSEQVEGVSR